MHTHEVMCPHLTEGKLGYVLNNGERGIWCKDCILLEIERQEKEVFK